MDHPLSHLRPVLRSETLAFSQYYILLLFTSVLAVAGIYQLIFYIILFSCLYSCLSVVLTHNVVLSHTGRYYVYMYICIYVLCIYVYMNICIYVSMYLCIYVSMYLSAIKHITTNVPKIMSQE